MYKREDSVRLRQEFWTAFGRYMQPVPSSEGLKVNWINYRTTIKDVYFRMQVDKQSAIISISIEHPDQNLRELYFQQFEELKTLLHETLEEEWEWQLTTLVTDQKKISRIYKELHGFSVFKRDDWHNLISFFKPRIIALDKFWEDAKYSFEKLR